MEFALPLQAGLDRVRRVFRLVRVGRVGFGPLDLVPLLVLGVVGLLLELGRGEHLLARRARHGAARLRVLRVLHLGLARRAGGFGHGCLQCGPLAPRRF